MREIFTGFSAEEYRGRRRAFTRDGAIDGEALIAFLLFLVADAGKRGYALLLDAFRDQVRSYGLPAREAFDCSASAWCAARRKFDPQFIRKLVHRVAAAHDARFRPHAPRYFAVDGSKFNLQRSAELRRAFGVPEGAHCPQLMVSTLFDLDTLVPHDVVIAPFATNERQELVALLDHVRRGDTVVLDRGYPSFEILRIFVDYGIRFVMRVPASSTFAAVEEFLQGSADDALARIQPPKGHPLAADGPVDVRLVRAAVPGGAPWVLLASPPADAASPEDVAALYRRRWEIEEHYRVAKSGYLGLGQFHARSAAGVQQEIFAQALYLGLTRYLTAAAAEARGDDDDAVLLSTKAAVLAVADHLTRVLTFDGDDAAARRLVHLLTRLRIAKEPRRAGRSCPRRSYLPARKWGPGGRRGG